MKRNLSYFVLSAILLNIPATVFCQKQGSLIIKGRDISASTTSLRILKGGLLKDSLYTIPVKNGNFYALLDLDEGIQQVVVLIGKKPIATYASSGDVVDITGDFTKSSLTKIQGANTLKTQLLSFDASAIASRRRDSVFAFIINKAADDAEKYRLCTYYYNMELNDLLSKENILKQELERYVNELYFSYANKMSTYGLYSIEHLSDSSAIRFHDRNIVPGARHFEKVSEKIFLQSPACRQYLFNKFRFEKSDSSDVELMIKYSGNVKKAAPWKEYQKAKYIDNPFIKDWFKAKSVVFSFNHYNVEETDNVMKLFLNECQHDQFKEYVANTVKGFSFLKNGIKAPAFALHNEQGRSVSLTDFAGKVIYLNFWGIHCGPCINEIKNELPLMRNKYKDVVIINICIEGKIPEWKNAIAKYGMKDINLYDPMNKVSRLYNISSVPHNILIDKQGNIFDYNAAAPNTYTKNDNSIDELIK